MKMEKRCLQNLLDGMQASFNEMDSAFTSYLQNFDSKILL